ncbi:MAG: FtsQ-type POTRA domain-containing protein [Nitrospira sp. SB0677_bin_15]|nr:FtsQ-type POTRA domain-containing protein [Nitrospira sp. SB0667_bin_9]MYD31225.1 FtsQ-type POTRA domain-containing protein [Nitrospira sp. SB0661_bin_20]MYG40813.1 FtsQ-type POTRA domain-containing protein [Nitrospira sp. SB0677_bin_15]MYH02648.1 FtsQ-type POTRA domain-containing protein [Nitrospira sp. SB0675_bin_23]
MSRENRSLRPAPARRRWTRMIQGGLAGILIILGMLGYQWLPSAVAGLLSIKRVSISGAERLDRRVVLSLLDLPADRSLLSVDPSSLEQKVEAHPAVASASVGRVLPHTLTVIVVERKPAALFQHAGGTLFLDKEGVVLSLAPDWPVRRLPELIGLSAVKILGGDLKIQAQARKGLRFAKDLQDHVAPAVSVDLSDPRFMVGKTDGLVFRVNNDFQNMWDPYLELEPTLRERFLQGPHEIDLRFTGKVIVRKEG